MGAFVKTTRICAVAVLGFGLSLGIAVSGDPSAAQAAQSSTSSQSSQDARITITSSTEIQAGRPFDIAGIASSDSRISIFGLPEGIVDVRADAAGEFSYRTKSSLTAGVRTLVFATSSGSTNVQYRVGDTAGTVPEIVPLRVDVPTYVPGRQLTLSGSATPGASIRIQALSAGVPGATVPVRADGKWTFTTSDTVAGLVHEVDVRQSTPHGGDSTKLTVRADAASFTPLQVDAPEYVPGQRLTLSGSATPGNTVEVRVESAAVVGAKVKAGADGKWSFTTGHVVTGRTHLASISQLAAGVASTKVTIEAPDTSFEPLRVHSTTYVPGDTTHLTGRATAGANIRLTLENPGGKPVPGGVYEQFRTVVGADGVWSIDIPQHVLIKANVKQQSELGTETVEFEFTEK